MSFLSKVSVKIKSLFNKSPVQESQLTQKEDNDPWHDPTIEDVFPEIDMYDLLVKPLAIKEGSSPSKVDDSLGCKYTVGFLAIDWYTGNNGYSWFVECREFVTGSVLTGFRPELKLYKKEFPLLLSMRGLCYGKEFTVYTQEEMEREIKEFVNDLPLNTETVQ